MAKTHYKSSAIVREPSQPARMRCGKVAKTDEALALLKGRNPRECAVAKENRLPFESVVWVATRANALWQR